VKLRPKVVLSLAAATLLAVAGHRWQASRVSAQEAAENWNACLRLSQNIEGLKSSPTQATLQKQSQQELTSLIEQSAKTVKISELIGSIRPEAHRRVGRTAFVEYPTRIELRQGGLNQIVGFLLEVMARDNRILPTFLRLTPPRNRPTADAETWQAEVVLTYLVFSPESGTH
jgi:hypothetical protein